MIPAFQTLIEHVHDAGDRDSLSDAMTAFGGAFGFTKFTYLEFPPSGTDLPAYVTTYTMAWVQQYIERSYLELDPVVERARSAVMPFIRDCRDADAQETPARRQFAAEASEFGIERGLTVPIPITRRGNAALTVVSDQTVTQLRRTVSQYRNILHLAAIYFHLNAEEKLGTSTRTGVLPLDARETACLQWLTQGKNLRDISKILCETLSSLQLLLTSAQNKLNANSLSQAVAIALHRRLIEF